jgi:hypothetical protein
MQIDPDDWKRPGVDEIVGASSRRRSAAKAT